MVNEEYAEWLKSEIDYYGRYHNHKETMAWTVTAFYLPSIVGLAYVANTANWGNKGNIGLTILFVLLAVAVFILVRMQFRMRREAADIVAGLERAMMAVVLGAMQPLSQDDREIEEGEIWPRFIKREMSKMGEIQTQRCKIDDLRKTEFATYCAILVVSSLAILLVWK